ncbi:MAG: Metal-dependent hydrolase [uncultured Thermomicrobiales bacterium]|uniref:Metal-dependent hydrolase n=1 Tax=uncultured Thermomicrobiales bacterium TaxID=1645740 RepID=A0A6J4V9K8_9BACT|nr:MAG: Metal-dependent hydrolase [uncultured Thermomicrobiales bacterium]
MCSPLVMAKVRETLNRRQVLGASAVTGAALVAGGFVRSGSAVAMRQATPVAAGGTPVAAGGTRVLDLTHVLTEEFPVFPGFPQASLEVVNTVADNGFYTLQLNMGEHVGTHMDAPAHFIDDGETADQLSVENLVAPLVVVDISARAENDDDAMLTVDDLLAWEGQYGAIPTGAIVAMYSGWETRLSDPATFLNQGADDVLHFPGFDPEAAAFLVEERTIKAVASDTISIDIGASTDFGVHLTILGAGLFGLESVANLADAPPSGATLIVGGPKHEGGSGGPTRLIALL